VSSLAPPPEGALDTTAEDALTPHVPDLAHAPVSAGTVFQTWWPLAASWLLMGLELPSVSAAIARLPDPEHSLAAYGGVVFPIALIIESPIIMLLAASTALSRDLASYRLGRRFMLGLGLSFSTLHGIVAFSPLYDVLARRVIGVPEEIVEPARLGLRIMLPWTISIAFRRFHQGVLIRFGHSRAVSIGTAVRLTALVTVLGLGLALRRWPGIVVGATAVVAGVVCEAIYAGWRVRPVIAGPVRAARPVVPPLDAAQFLRFYLPLLITPLFTFLTMPLASGAMSRLPRVLDSLATWPALNGFVFVLRAVGFAFNEVVVSLWEHPGAPAALRRFAVGLAATTSSILLLLAVTPAGHAWFAHVSALSPPLAALGAFTLWIALPMPGLAALQSLHQGALVHAHRTRGITEAVVACLVVAALAMVALAKIFPGAPGLPIAMGGLVAGNAVQLWWLSARARSVRVAH
jgi:hypothetical protein